MTIENKAATLLEALTDYIRAVRLDGSYTVAQERDEPAKAEKPAAVSKENKADISELKKTAKQKAGKVLKELGKDKLGELLNNFGAKKFSDLREEAEFFTSFIKLAEAMLQVDTAAPAPEVDDLLDDAPAPEPEVARTLEDVKKLLLKINNTPELGREITKQVLGELGVMRLSELTADKFSVAYDKAASVLNNADGL